MGRDPDWSVAPQPHPADVAAVSDTVTPDIQRVGRWFYEVKLRIQPAATWIGLETQPALVLGKRWARWKARRMMAAELRSDR